MKPYVLGAIIVLASHVALQDRQPAIVHAAPVAQRQLEDCKNPRLIAHIEHDGLSFSIRIDPADGSFLSIDVPEKNGSVDASSPPAVRLKVLMTDDAILEGAAVRIRSSVSNGGWDEIVGLLFESLLSWRTYIQ